MKSSRRSPWLPWLAAWLALGGMSCSALAQKTGSRGVTRVEWQGRAECLNLESRDTPIKAVLAPSLGGRVLSYGARGENLLWVNPETVTQSLAANGGNAFQPGGAFCDVGPQVANLPPHLPLQLGPYEWSARKNFQVQLRSPEDKGVRVEIEKEIVFDPATGDLGFLHRLKNLDERDAAYCLWQRIACRPGGYVFFPLNKKSRFANGWSIGTTTNGRLDYNGTQPQSPAVRVLDGVLVAQTGGEPTQIGADSDAQWIAYALGKSLFVIHFPVYSTGTYSEGGNSVTVNWTSQMTELGAFSAEARLRPRKTAEFPVKWAILDLPAEVTSAEQARALVEKVPASPFL